MGMGHSEGSGRTKRGAFLALLIWGGCGVAMAPTAAQAEPIRYRCPDPTTDCTQSNGTGVYTGEDGHAWIDDAIQLMITNFQNNAGSVTFQGRYYSAPQKWWLMLPSAGNVWSADYGGLTRLTVKSVSEVGTLPTWTLEDAGGDIYEVSGDKLLQLQLHLSFADPATGKIAMYILGFDAAVDEKGHNGKGVHKYNMNWRADVANSTPQQYCFDAKNNPDPVVFQQGLFVNPTTAAVTRDTTTAGTVMLSCRLGGPATVWWWGYDYLGKTASTFFDAGLQMKRASYCADSHHYTHSGTHIFIADSSGIEDAPIDEIESFWTAQGALCLTTMRHADEFPEFDMSRTCNGQVLQLCPTLADRRQQPGNWLVDAVDPAAQ
jgi:ADYC domain